MLVFMHLHCKHKPFLCAGFKPLLPVRCQPNQGKPRENLAASPVSPEGGVPDAGTGFISPCCGASEPPGQPRERHSPFDLGKQSPTLTLHSTLLCLLLYTRYTHM